MLTELSNTRSSNLYLTLALTVLIVVILSFAAAPAISLGKPAPVAAAAASETGSDYYQRHPELRVSGAGTTDLYGRVEGSDYFGRHPELNDRPGMACESPVDCR